MKVKQLNVSLQNLLDRAKTMKFLLLIRYLIFKDIKIQILKLFIFLIHHFHKTTFDFHHKLY